MGKNQAQWGTGAGAGRGGGVKTKTTLWTWVGSKTITQRGSTKVVERNKKSRGNGTTGRGEHTVEAGGRQPDRNHVRNALDKVRQQSGQVGNGLDKTSAEGNF